MSLDRREFLGSSVVTGAGVALAGGAPAAEAVEVREQGGRGHGHRRERYAFTVMGTTDLHGNVFNWDYAMDAEFDDAAHNDVGLAKISTLVTQVRQEKGRHNTLLIDAGDTIQGTQLAYYYAKVDPITDPDGPVHPMARAMNAVGYDAAALGIMSSITAFRCCGSSRRAAIFRWWARMRWMRGHCVRRSGRMC